MQFIDLKSQYQSIRQEINRRITTVLGHGQYILGEEVRELEARLGEYVGVRHCIGVASGTDALLIALMTLDIGAGDEVITTPFTFIATGEVIALLGAKPVFIDIEPRTCNLDPSLVEQAITNKTKAILAVSLYGQCADFDAIKMIAKRYGITVIEDGAQSFGATYKGQRSCGLTDIGCTSFFPSKPLGCYGDGGAIFTNNDELAEKMRQIRVHGQDRRYHHERLGINGRMDTIQAAVLLAKLDIFEHEVEERIRIGSRYSSLLSDSAVGVPYIYPENTSVYGQYTIQIDRRDQVKKFLANADIPTAVHYPIPLYQQPAMRQEGMSLRYAEQAADSVLSLPMHPYLSDREQDHVVDAVLKAVEK